MKYLFAAGSLGRPSLPVLKWARGLHVFVEPHELDLYEAENAGRGSDTAFIHAHPKSGLGFSGMMNRLLQECRSRGAKYLVFTDDDVYGLRDRFNIDDKKFNKVTPDRCQQVISNLVDLCDFGGYAQLAVSFAANSWAAKRAYDPVAGAWGVHVTSVDAALSVGGYDEQLAVFSDWDLTARMVMAGYRCPRTNLVTFEHKMRGMPGGAAHLYEQQEKVLNSARRVKMKLPEGSCEIKWIENHGQHEIRINWKKLQKK